MNQQDHRNLQRRDSVSPLTMALLARADGLDLLTPGEYVAEHTELRASPACAVGESYQGLTLDSNRLAHVILVTDEVFYPQPGWSKRADWEDGAPCREACAFPLSCSCY